MAPALDTAHDGVGLSFSMFSNSWSNLCVGLTAPCNSFMGGATVHKSFIAVVQDSDIMLYLISQTSKE